jgi:hypothetical protein
VVLFDFNLRTPTTISASEKSGEIRFSKSSNPSN